MAQQGSQNGAGIVQEQQQMEEKKNNTKKTRKAVSEGTNFKLLSPGVISRSKARELKSQLAIKKIRRKQSADVVVVAAGRPVLNQQQQDENREKQIGVSGGGHRTSIHIKTARNYCQSIVENKVQIVLGNETTVTLVQQHKKDQQISEGYHTEESNTPEMEIQQNEKHWLDENIDKVLSGIDPITIYKSLDSQQDKRLAVKCWTTLESAQRIHSQLLQQQQQQQLFAPASPSKSASSSSKKGQQQLQQMDISKPDALGGKSKRIRKDLTKSKLEKHTQRMEDGRKRNNNNKRKSLHLNDKDN